MGKKEVEERVRDKREYKLPCYNIKCDMKIYIYIYIYI
jgi:hypothetical protein